MVFQDPMSSLDPVYRVGHQIASRAQSFFSGIADAVVLAAFLVLNEFCAVSNVEVISRHGLSAAATLMIFQNASKRHPVLYAFIARYW